MGASDTEGRLETEHARGRGIEGSLLGLGRMGLSFGLALIGAAVVTYAARATQEADVEDATFEAAAEEPVDLDTSATQPA